MRPRRAAGAESEVDASDGMPIAAMPATEALSSVRRVTFRIGLCEIFLRTENRESRTALLPPFLQHRLAIARSREHFVKRGLLAQIFEQGIVQQGVMSAVILLHRGLQQAQRWLFLPAR